MGLIPAEELSTNGSQGLLHDVNSTFLPACISTNFHVGQECISRKLETLPYDSTYCIFLQAVPAQYTKQVR